MRPEETVDFHIKRTWQSISKMYNEVASRFESTMATGFVLLNIDVEKGTPSTQLGPKMGVEATSLSRLLKSMEEKGLVVRKSNPEDKRSVLICLTEFGIEKRVDAKKAVYDFNHLAQKSLGDKKIKNLIAGLEELNELIVAAKFQNQ